VRDANLINQPIDIVTAWSCGPRQQLGVQPRQSASRIRLQSTFFNDGKGEFTDRDSDLDAVEETRNSRSTRSQSRTVRSWLHDARRRPSGWKASPLTMPACPRGDRRRLPVVASHTSIVPSK
jgi:hypothetical protein